MKELKLRGKMNHPSSDRRRVAKKGFELGLPVPQPGLKISTALSCCFM